MLSVFACDSTDPYINHPFPRAFTTGYALPVRLRPSLFCSVDFKLDVF